jgi:hypothetical protein
MNRRLLSSGLVALLAIAALSGCSLLPSTDLGDKSPTVESPSDEPTDEGVDYTDEQLAMFNELFLATTGKPFLETRDLVGAELADQAAAQYLEAADALCGLDPAVRAAPETHTAFVNSATSNGGITTEAAENMWSAMSTYCATQD